MTSDLLIERKGAVVLATLNRPDAKNALNGAIIDGLFALAEEMEGDRTARALVLKGAGGTFCAGGDVKEFAGQLMAPAPGPGEADPAIAANRRFGDLLLKLDALPKVVICAVEGAAFGGAMGLVAIADVALAAPGAKFSLSETTLGLVPAQIGPFVLRRIGLFNARRLALTGARFGPDEALNVGLIDRVAGPEGLERAIAATLNDVLRCEPDAVAATKALFNRAAPPVAPELLDFAAAEFARCLRGAGRLGAAAFARKEKAPWAADFAPDETA